MSSGNRSLSRASRHADGVVQLPHAKGKRSRLGLRVLMISPQPFFRARGTPFSILHRIRGLVAAGHSVDLLTYPFGRDIPVPKLRVIRCQRPPFVRDVRVGPSVAKVSLDIFLYRLAKRALREGHYDVVHSHEEAAFFGVRLAKRYGLLHVYDMHSSLPQQLGNFGAYNWAPFRALFSGLERHALASSDGVITVCPDLAELVEKICPSQVHALIENTADDTRVFAPAEIDMRERWGLADKKIVLYTGTLEAYQGIDLLIAAMPDLLRQMADVHLLIVGGRPEQIEHFRRLAIQSRAESAITFAGTQPPADMPAYAAAADVIVSPRSDGTNTPGKIYGYMRSGRPLVATDLLTHTQVLDSTVAELVPASSRGLLDGLHQVLSNPDHGQALANAARRRADEQYSDEAYLRRVAGFYASVMQSAEESAENTPG